MSRREFGPSCAFPESAFPQLRRLAAGLGALLFLWSLAAVEPHDGWHQEQGHRWKDLPVAREGHTGFTLLRPDQTGVAFTNRLQELHAAENRVLLNGSGLAVGDFDGDGRPDLFFCGLDTPCALYRNLGDFKFRDVTDQAGVRLPGGNYRGAVFADVNGDGHLDLLVSALGRGVICLVNDGHGHFQDATASAGTASQLGSTTLALADVDGDGTLDLYVANYRNSDIRDRGQVNLYQVNGQLVVPPAYRDRLLVSGGQVLEYGEPDQLYLNDGRGHFAPVSWTGGAFLDEAGKPLSRPPLEWGLTVTFRDINQDGAPDIYVCNDYWPPDRLWLNDGQGRFRAAPPLTLRHTSASSMGVDFADLDRDGAVDFLVVDMLSRDPALRKRQMPAYSPRSSPVGAIEDRPQLMRNTLFHNRGDGTFEEIAEYSGLIASDWSWQPVFMDVDLDGFEDLVVPAGYPQDVQDLDANQAIAARQHSWANYKDDAQRQKAFTLERMMHSRLYPRLPMPVVTFRNNGDLRFTETTGKWGTGELGVHQAIVVADLDGDGDLDLIVNNLGSAAGIYRNETIAPRVAVRLRGLPPNTQGIGAKVTLRGGPVPLQSMEIICGGRYLSGSEPMAVFAAGGADGKGADSMTLEVRWRSGKETRVSDVRANREYEVQEVRLLAPVLP